ncbi:hypothetical protein JCM10449v2_005800 [Rhodotorula kratochvilovae]
MAGSHQYKWEGSTQSSYPPSSTAASQGTYIDSYPPYEYSAPSAASTPGPEYHSTTQPLHYAPLSYQPSTHYATQPPPSHHSRSSSEAEERASNHAHAPVHSTFVVPAPHRHGSGTISPSSLYEHPSQHTPRLSDQQHQFSPPMQHHAPPYAAPTTRTSSRVERPTLPSMFSRASHHPGADGAYSSRGPLPVGVVSSSDGWGDGSGAGDDTTLELPLPPTMAAPSGSGAKKKASVQAPRKRVPASCTPCRKKKLRCNRSMPCASCVERGDPEGCIWEGDAVPLFVAREENDVKELKAQVDRLQHLLDALSQSTPPVPPPVGRTAGPAAASLKALGKQRELVEPDSAKFDLHAQDLCEALSELALNGVMPAQRAGAESFAPGGYSGEVFVDEAKDFLLSFTQQAGLASDVGFTVLTPSSGVPSPPSPTYPSADASMQPISTLGPSTVALSAAMLNVRPSMSQVLELLPSDAELQSTYEFYASFVHWYSSPLSLAQFEQRWPAFRKAMAHPDPAQREQDVDPLFVATLLGACASGLASMTNKQAKARGFPENRSAIVERWVRAAMLSLVVGKFMEEPSLDGIRAFVIIASLYIFMTTGETISAGMSLLSLAVHGVFALQLHRDPLHKGKTQYSFAECEERRRLFWCVFSLCMSITTGTSRTWTQFDLRQIDCKFPLDCFDSELSMDERAAKARVRSRRAAETFEETPMTASLLRAQYGLIVKKITDKAFSITPCSYSDVLALDAELVAFERSFPPAYDLPIDGANRVHFGVPPSLTEMRAALIQLCLSAEFVRLHRPFLVLAATDDRYQHSREQCVKYAKRLLAINATPGCKLNWAGHNFKVLSAAITLGIELLQSPNEPDAPIIRNMVDLALKQAEGFASVSSVCRKGSGVVRFILSKVDEEASSASAPRQAKRARTLFYSPEDQKPPRQSLAQALGGAPTAPSSCVPSPDEHNTRRRKATRPPLVHVMSDTIVPRVMATPTQAMVQAPMLRSTRSRSADQVFPTLNTLGAATAQGSQSAEATYAPYAVAPPARQIAGIGSASSRRARNSSASTAASGSNASASAAFAAGLSSPEMAMHLQLPAAGSYMHGNGPLSSSSTTGAFDFGELSLASGQATSSASMLDEGGVQGFFDLPATAFSRTTLSQVAEGAQLPVGVDEEGAEALTAEDLAYLQQYQH